MNIELARQAITSKVEQVRALYSPTLIVEYDNRILVDRATQVDPFVMVDLLFISGNQASLGLDTLVRNYGQIVLTASAKENTGMKQAAEILDFFSARLEIREFGGVRTKGASPQKCTHAEGWYHFPVIIPFWFDRLAQLT